MTRRTDLGSLATGLVLLVVSGYFLVDRDRTLEDVVEWLVPVALVVAGVTLVLGALLRDRRRD